MNQLLKSAIAAFYRLLEVIMVLCMVVMLIMVFGNVMLRLFLNSGIDLSEEMPRFAFIWLTFLGAIVGLHRRAHLGVDMVVRALPLIGRKVCWGISQAIMLICAGYILYGTWLQHEIIAGNASPVAQISTLWVYGVSYVTGTAIAIICIANLVRLLLGMVEEHELIDVNEEGMSEIQEVEHELAEQIARKGS
ncbi:TRAP transporter small permease [Ancylobacter defluvii]|uniref:TRAP transporter small permease protein n=1 Tax=Ancylobacter defluvii TaxID=1282440 RepID=A0A9W6JXG7_9HYPH|nr:TRAP transporter small permease [Ancylobacter defluvii]MBS7585925.1 TRAP transporter small permease [Ancylobacter defluvii]GLK84303.1 ABC transporter permease [Ancylobacter defluvii]